MKKRYSFFVLLISLLLPFSGWTQTIGYPVVPAGNPCAGSVISVSFTTSGSFATDNTFRAQLSSDYGNSFIDLPGSFVSSPASVTLPASLNTINSYVIRIVAQKPLVFSSSSSSFMANRTPTAQLTGSSTEGEPVNPYTPVNLRVSLSGGGSYTLTLQDSTRIVNYDVYSSSFAIPVAPARTTTYRLARVQNSCGTGPASGSAIVSVNPVGFRLLSTNGEAVCYGKQLPVYYSADGPLPPNTTFEGELVGLSSTDQTIPVKVSGTASPLLVTLPTPLETNPAASYRLRIFSRSAGLSAWYRDRSLFTFDAPPRLSLTGPGGVPFGGQATLTLSATSLSGGDVLLSDGQVVSVFGNRGGYGTQALVTVKPGVTTSYSIVSFAGACADGISYDSRAARVQVGPGLRIDSLSTSEVCAGQPVTLYYTASPGYSPPSNLQVRFDNGSPADVVATKPGQLVFTSPVSTTPVQSQEIRLTFKDRADSVLSKAALPLRIKTKASFSFSYPTYLQSSPGYNSLGYTITGGGNTTVLLNTGVRLSLMDRDFSGPILSMGGSIEVIVAGTTTFSVASVSNECGGIASDKTTTVTVQNSGVLSTGVTLRSASTVGNTIYTSCPGAQVWLNATPTGTFGPNNQFRLELSDGLGTFITTPLMSLTKTEPISLTLPTQNGYYRVRVATTDPVTRSTEITYYVDYAPLSAGVTLQAPSGISTAGSSVTVVAGQTVKALYTILGRGPFTYELADGRRGILRNNTIQTTYQPTVNTTYAIKRVTDGCGLSTTSTSSQQVNVVATLLTTGNAGISACVQTPLLVPFKHVGNVPTSVSYVVQVSDDQLTWTTLPTSGLVSPLTATLSPSLANKSVYYRVAYQDNGLVAGLAAPTKLLIRSTPTVALTGPNNASVVQLDRSLSTTVQLNVTDPYTEASVVVSNGKTVYPVSIFGPGGAVFVTQPGTFSIVSAYNTCGYGTGQGSVTISEKPYLAQLRLSKYQACVGEAVSFTYVAAGDYEAGNKLSFALVPSGIMSGSAVALGESTALSGVVSFSLNPALQAGSYYVRVETSAPKTTLYGFTLDVDGPISATLLSGTRVVYANDPSFIRVVGSNARPYSLTLAGPGSQSVIAAFSGLTDIPVTLTQSGSYSIVGVSNVCGPGRATGSASFSVLPDASVTIRPELFGGPYCTGRQYIVYLRTTGVFSTTNAFTAYLFDSTGSSQQVLPTLSSPTQITVTILATLPVGDRYVLRVGSSAPAHLGASLFQPVSIRQSPTGTLSGNSSIFKGDSTKISVALTGTPPWQLTITDLFGPRVFTTTKSPFELIVKPDADIGYRLTDVRDSQCGAGTATGTALVTVAVLLSTEPALPLTVRVFPNPTSAGLQIEGDWPTGSPVAFVLTTATGRQVHESVNTPAGGRLSHRIDLSGQPTGVYILTAEADGRRSQFKVLKQ
ncbi:T9SS type A sorting domain-containing protein [Fibrella sp. HMF5335]|uniref:T9SS type A sorting domain-containing protein n=1 Tax=Fibrella rubiginis TaxID=2817060 RepID=A0A939GEC3_9BACT|nr:T9SS type A sorting domain-containing protein [Fibrella rubiginis]MBO0935265.1 T9SS type A sorting domain-containing protein [Fibrella rubiginis]